MNENRNTTSQNLWDATNTVEKFIDYKPTSRNKPKYIHTPLNITIIKKEKNNKC